MVDTAESLFLDMRSTYALFFKALLFAEAYAALGVYEPVREYAGSGFFSEWDYYGNVDNTTWGNVSYVDRQTGTRDKLTFVDSSTGHAIIRVDNTTNIEAGSLSAYRKSVKIASKDAYLIGSLIIIDAVHIPYGCSVWPAFWTLGTELGWPHAGELVLIEGINGITANNMVMHTDPGCVQSPGVDQGGKTLATDCNSDVGCKVEETKSDSYGKGFAKAGGGVFALKIDVEGVFMWFWSRRDIPSSISQARSDSAIDISDWGKPSAVYSAVGCDIEKFFKPQKLILDITLCGQWAGIPEVYAETCPGECISNMYGDGSNYATAYWEIAYIRTFSAKALASRAVARDSSPTDVGTELTTSTVVGSVAISSSVDVSASPVSESDLPVVTLPSLPLTSLDPAPSAPIFHPTIPISPSTVIVDDPTVLTTSHLITTILVTVDINHSDNNFPVTSTINYSSLVLVSTITPPVDVPTAVGQTGTMTPSIEESDTDGHLTVTQISSVLVLTVPTTMNTTLERVGSTVSSDLGQSTSSSSGSASSSTITVVAIYVLVLTVFFTSQ